MNYDPSVRDVYQEHVDSRYTNNCLRGCRRDTFRSALDLLMRGYDDLRAQFETVGESGHYVYVIDEDEHPKSNAQVFLYRYLSGVYRVLEALKICLAASTNDPSNLPGLHPPMSPALSKWDGEEGRQPWDHASDEVMTRLTYLRGIRNALVHGTDDCFDADVIGDEVPGVLLSLCPDKLDEDPAVSGYDPSSEDRESYCYTDTYLRFEESREEAVYPVDNIMKYHDEILFPFLLAFRSSLGSR